LFKTKPYVLQNFRNWFDPFWIPKTNVMNKTVKRKGKREKQKKNGSDWPSCASLTAPAQHGGNAAHAEPPLPFPLPFLFSHRQVGPARQRGPHVGVVFYLRRVRPGL
jgi:hypothetical protein